MTEQVQVGWSGARSDLPNSLDISPCVDMILQLRAIATVVLSGPEFFGDTACMMAHMIEKIDMALAPQFEKGRERRRKEMIDTIQQTYVVDAKTGYDVHVQGPDLAPGRPALRYIVAVNLSREEAEAKGRELLGKPFRYGVTNIAVAHLYAGDRVVAHFRTARIGKEGR